MYRLVNMVSRARELMGAASCQIARSVLRYQGYLSDFFRVCLISNVSLARACGARLIQYDVRKGAKRLFSHHTGSLMRRSRTNARQERATTLRSGHTLMNLSEETCQS